MNGSGPGLIEAVVESWRLVVGNAGSFARVAFVPFLIFIALNRLDSAFMPEGMAALACIFCSASQAALGAPPPVA